MKKPQGDAPAGWYDSPENPDSFQFWNGKYWVDKKILKGEDSPEVLPLPIKKNFVKSIKHTLMKTFAYKGRASMREYWYFQVFYIVSIGVTAIIFADAGIGKIIPAAVVWGLIPTQLALYVRRCHDSNKPGWWYFIPIGNIIAIFSDSDAYENRFGEPSF